MTTLEAYYKDLFENQDEGAPTLFNTVENDPKLEPMFFGQGVNVSRFDQMKYPKFDQLTKQQMGFFWDPDEAGLGRDRVEYQNLHDHEKHIFDANLKYQTLMDSIQGRAPMTVLLELVSIPELEPWLNVWSSFESVLHSRSYSHIIQNVYPNPSEALGNIIINEEIIKRAKAMVSYGDKLHLLNTIKRVREYGFYVDGIPKEYQDIESNEFKVLHARTLIMYLYTTYLLEKVRFYVSFSCSFSFASRPEAVMSGNAKIIKWIARDEQLHGTAVLHMLNYLKSSEGEWWANVYASCEPDMLEAAKLCYEQERGWAEYLFQYGGMTGVNFDTSVSYLEHIIDDVNAPLGLPALFGKPRNPYPWIRDWLNSDEVQFAPQETEPTSYLTGVKNDVELDENQDIDDLLG